MALVLVLDDEEANRRLLGVLLEHCGHEVLASTNGWHALELLAEHRPQLAIVDLYMPDMSGTEFIKRVRKHDSDVRDTVIALYTGTQVDGTMRDFMAMMQIKHIIPKPGEPEAIIAAITRALG